ncbi:hypothetical protein GGR51DRAFT_251754 [Nemania sp. FL0031]|nr:hypothetical protein GGR51DRAFT_251754 [Nemania sp. FL0031]
MSPLSVRRWIESLEPRPAKRRRCDLDDNRDASDDDFNHPYNTPNTPSPTNSNVDMPKGTRGRKRAGDALGDDDLASSIPSDTRQLLQDTTPKLLPTLPKPSSSTSSPKRQRSTSPIKSRLDLQLLEKPVYISGLEGDITSVLPVDIQSLYTQLQAAGQFQTSIVPVEVRSKVFGQAPADSGLGTAAPDPVKTAVAEAVLSRIRDILHEAVLSTDQQRHECGWNNLVHTPLLKLAFNSQLEISKPDVVSVRLEPVMTVPIARDSVPRLQTLFTDSDVSSVLAWSLSHESTGTSQSGDFNPAQIRTSSDNRKVDYVVVLDIADNTPLKQTISRLIMSHRDRTQPHVNQTLYPSISHSPIGLSIETKTTSASRDPLLQLGIWVAAWHKRMTELRALRLQQGVPVGTPTLNDPRVVSVPLIVVTGHDWDAYLACDEGNSIRIRGPLRIGGTLTVLHIYALLASLTAIRDWMKTTYFKSIAEWFVCES